MNKLSQDRIPLLSTDTALNTNTNAVDYGAGRSAAFINTTVQTTSANTHTILPVSSTKLAMLKAAFKEVFELNEVEHLVKPSSAWTWVDSYSANFILGIIRFSVVMEGLYWLFSFQSTVRAVTQFGVKSPGWANAIGFSTTTLDLVIGLFLVNTKDQILKDQGLIIDDSTGKYRIKVPLRKLNADMDWNKAEAAVTSMLRITSIQNVNKETLYSAVSNVIKDRFANTITSRNEKEAGNKISYIELPEAFLKKQPNGWLPLSHPHTLARYLIGRTYKNWGKILIWLSILCSLFASAYSQVQGLTWLADPKARNRIHLPEFLFVFAEMITSNIIYTVLFATPVTIAGVAYYYKGLNRVSAELGNFLPGEGEATNKEEYKAELEYLEKNYDGVLKCFFQNHPGPLRISLGAIIGFASLRRGFAFAGIAESQPFALAHFGTIVVGIGAVLAAVLEQGPSYVERSLAPLKPPKEAIIGLGDNRHVIRKVLDPTGSAFIDQTDRHFPIVLRSDTGIVKGIAPFSENERRVANTMRTKRQWLKDTANSFAWSVMCSFILLYPLSVFMKNFNFVEKNDAGYVMLNALDFLRKWLPTASVFVLYIRGILINVVKSEEDRAANVHVYKHVYGKSLEPEEKYHLNKVSSLSVLTFCILAQIGRLLSTILFVSESFPLSLSTDWAVPIAVGISVMPFMMQIELFYDKCQKSTRSVINLTKKALGYPDTTTPKSGLYLYCSFLRHCEGGALGEKLAGDIVFLPVGFLKQVITLLKLILIQIPLFAVQSLVIAIYALSVLACLPTVALYDAGTALWTGLTHAGAALWNGDCHMPSCTLPSSLSGLFGGTTRSEEDSEEMLMTEIPNSGVG